MFPHCNLLKVRSQHKGLFFNNKIKTSFHRFLRPHELVPIAMVNYHWQVLLRCLSQNCMAKLLKSYLPKGPKCLTKYLVKYNQLHRLS